jgi:hypothetical protein
MSSMLTMGGGKGPHLFLPLATDGDLDLRHCLDETYVQTHAHRLLVILSRCPVLVSCLEVWPFGLRGGTGT